jgi:hypothetical protein
MEEQGSRFGEVMLGLGMDLLVLLKVAAILFAAWFVERLIYFGLRRAYKRSKAKGARGDDPLPLYAQRRAFPGGASWRSVAIIYVIPAFRAM